MKTLEQIETEMTKAKKDRLQRLALNIPRIETRGLNAKDKREKDRLDDLVKRLKTHKEQLEKKDFKKIAAEVFDKRRVERVKNEKT